MRELLEVLNRYRERLLALDGVVGCGLGHKRRKGENTGQRAVVILVERKRPIREIPAGHAAPARLDGVPTDVMQTGRMRLLSEIRTSRARPAPPGVSIGHVDVTAGTFGAVAKDAVSGAPMILSNNHVLANSSDGRDMRAQIGDPILQPGFFDGGRVPGDVIGRLARFAPIRRLSGGRVEINRADAALAEPLQNDLVSPEVLGLGLITGIADAEADMKLRKSGRTTGVTSGEVRALAVTLDVALGEGDVARFSDVFVTTVMGAPGDSGSVGLDAQNRAVGLLFAGSSDATAYNPMRVVCDVLGCRLD